MSSDSDEFSDEDYNPDKDVSAAGSELESDDEVEDDLPEDSSEEKNTNTGKTKGKRVSLSNTSRSRKKPKLSEEAKEAVEEKPGPDDEEAEKRRADALWADFLGGDTEEPKEEKKQQPKGVKVEPEEKEKEKKTTPVPEKKKEPVIIKEIFEFAGEQVVVEKEVKEPASTSSSSRSAGQRKFPTGRASGGLGGGLGSILGNLNKKNKISTLEKTKLDWDRFKSAEGIAEDLNTHNRGKDGYLERQDFLQRTDVRQFEIERSMRQTTRSNR